MSEQAACAAELPHSVLSLRCFRLAQVDPLQVACAMGPEQG